MNQNMVDPDQSHPIPHIPDALPTPPPQAPITVEVNALPLVPQPVFDFDAALSRHKAFKAANRKATFWAMFKDVGNNMFSCCICIPSLDARSHKDKKEKKGLISYTSAHGTTSLRRHVKMHHGNEMTLLDAKIELMNTGIHARKKRKTSTQLRLFDTHQKYPCEHETQKRHDHDLLLLIAKANLPMNIVDNPFFKRYVSAINPRIKLPGRRTLTTHMIPEFTKHVFDRYVKPKLSMMLSVSITFDLWMTRGCQDIFDIIAHGMDEKFSQHCLHLRMLHCNSTSGEMLADALKSELEKHCLTSKVIACVKDGGSNLRTCTKSLQEIVSCKPLNMQTCFEGPCFAHILSGACNSAMNSKPDDELSEIDIKAARAALQKCITWTKKSGVGRDAWYASCREKQLTQRIMPTPVKTRFVSTIVMMSMMLKYREVVQHCFSNQESLELRSRVPSSTTWEVIRTIVDTLAPVMSACLISQTSKGWLLSDAIATCTDLLLKYRAMSAAEDGEINASSFGDQLTILRARLAKNLCKSLEGAVKPLLQFTPLEGKYVHHFIALCLDPKFKSLRNPFMHLYRTYPNVGRALVSRYDTEVLVPLLVRILEHKFSSDDQIPLVNTEQDSATLPEEDSKPDVVPHTSEDIECFIITDQESESQRTRRKLHSQLMDYRRESFDEKDETKFAWLARNRQKFPVVVELAQHILAIPATQIDNERVFSLAGRIASPLRSSIATSSIDNLVSVVQNYPNEAQRDVQHQQALLTMEEFSDFLVKIEEKPDETNDSVE